MASANDKQILAFVDAILLALTQLYWQDPRPEAAAAAQDSRLSRAASGLFPLLLPLVEGKPELLSQVGRQLFLQRLTEPGPGRQPANELMTQYCLEVLHELFRLRSCSADKRHASAAETAAYGMAAPGSGISETHSATDAVFVATAGTSAGPEPVPEQSAATDSTTVFAVSDGECPEAAGIHKPSPAEAPREAGSSRGILAPETAGQAEASAKTQGQIQAETPTEIQKEIPEETDGPEARLSRLLAWCFPQETVLFHWPFRSCSFDAYLPRRRLALRLGEAPKGHCRDSLWLKKEKIDLRWIPYRLLADPRGFRCRVKGDSASQR